MTSSRGVEEYLSPLNTPQVVCKRFKYYFRNYGIYTPNLNRKIIQEVYKSKDKALESLELRAFKYILGCSVTCVQAVLADLGLETLKYRRDLRKLKQYCKVKRMNDEKLPFKLLSNECNKVNSKGHPPKCWLTHVNSLKKELNLQDEVLQSKLIKET